MHADRFKIRVEGELRVQTEASLWLIRPGEYFRMPLVEAPRLPALSMDGALDDHRWMPYESLSVSRIDGYGDQVWILPAGRPAGSQGLHTGVVVNAEPALDDLRVEEPEH